MFSRSLQPKDIPALDQFKSFGKQLADETSMAHALVAGVFGLVVTAGRGDDKNTLKAIDHLYRQSALSHGLMKTGARLDQALEVLKPHAAPIHEFLRSRLNEGWDHAGAGLDAQPVDQDIIRAMVAEGLMRDYLIPPELRTHIKALAEAAHEVLSETEAWRKGREILAGISRAQCNSSVFNRHPALREYTAMIFMAARMTTDVMISVPGEQQIDSSAGGQSYSGPTAWSMTGLKVLFYQEFLRRVDAPGELKTLHLASDLLQNFKSGTHYLSAAWQSFAPSYLSARRDYEAIQTAELLITQQTKLMQHVEATEFLDALPVPDEASTAYLHAPPAYFVRYYTIDDKNPGRSSAIGVTNAVIQSHVPTRAEGDITVSDLPANDTSTANWITWSLSTDGRLRSSLFMHAVPLTAEDLAMNEDAFAEISLKLEQRTMRQVRQLGTVWERFPGLYSAPLQVEPGVVIVENGDSLSFVVKSKDSDALRNALARTTRDWPAGTYVIEEDLAENATYSYSITRTPSAIASAAPSTPSAVRRAEVSREFIASYCPQFRDLVRILTPFGVTLESGKGSHQKLMREGFMTVVSKNQRDGTLLLNEAVVLQILNRLQIGEEEFVRRTRKELSPS